VLANFDAHVDAGFYNQIMRGWLGVLTLVGCSSVTPFPSDDIATPFDGGPRFDATIPPDAPFDGPGADATKFNGGGPFDCLGCICDGTLNYCVFSSAGNAPIVDAGDAGTDADASSDGGLEACGETSTCTQIPIECLPKPTCDCVMQKYTGCTCDVDPSGNGLVITCVYP
jgi:hypothetical protein